MNRSWHVERLVGTAAEHHRRPLPEPMRRTVWWCVVEQPALVLGSTQSEDSVDRSAAEAAGVEIVRRRSGGGAVWVDPSSMTWVDVLLPTGDRLWENDVGRAANWLADVWTTVLSSLGVEGAVAHRGAMVREPDAATVCFAGRASGEVLIDGRKVVGVSARRSRAGARFQCSVLHRWEPERLVELLNPGDDDRSALAGRIRNVAVGIGPIPAEQVVGTFLEHLPVD